MRKVLPFAVLGVCLCLTMAAWAAGTPVLLLQVLLGLRPEEGRLTTVAPEVPSWAGDIRLSGVRAFGREWSVRLQNRRVSVE
jgi:hypothetical protein